MMISDHHLSPLHYIRLSINNLWNCSSSDNLMETEQTLYALPVNYYLPSV